MQPNGQQQPGQQPNGGEVQPQPMPTTWITSSLRLPTRQTLVMIEIATVSGRTVIFLEPQSAKTIAAQIEREASQAQTGLILPH